MKKFVVFISTYVTMVLAVASVMVSAEANADQTSEAPVFGQSLMSPQEVADFKTKLSNSVSAEQRKQIETEHHDRMIQRARWKGLVLPQPDKLTVATSD